MDRLNGRRQRSPMNRQSETEPYDPRGEGTLRLAIVDWLITWQATTEIQCKRVLAADDMWPRQREGWIFILTLRQVVRSAEWASQHTHKHKDRARASKVDKALNRFNEALPNAVEIRDVLTHFDEYERGEGNLQRKWGRFSEAVELNRFVEHGDGDVVIHLYPAGRMDVGQAAEAAERLADEILEAMSGG
jgi:hypothetical protein